MKNRGLAISSIALVIGMLASSFAFGQSADKKPEPAHKSNDTASTRCGLYWDGTYMNGEFDDSDSQDHFLREGMGFGPSCSYNNHSRVSFGIGGEFYFGRFRFDHTEDNLRGSATYLEKGFKEWLSATLNFHSIMISGLVGYESTNSSGFKISNVDVDIGNGWFDVTDLARQHLSSSGGVETWDVGLGVEFPFHHHNLSFMFGGLLQQYNLVLHLSSDSEGNKLLEALNYDTSKVNRDFSHSTAFVSLTPGLKWSTKYFDTTLTVPWGVFRPNKWTWGAVLKTEVKF